MSVVEHFDYKYPTLNRKDLMSLSTISPQDAITHKLKQLDTRRDWSLNLYNLDIERSSPKKISIFNNKIDFTNKNDDLEKSNSKFLHFKLNKPSYNLSNADIEKSSSNMGHLNTARCTNPLEPKYNLPRVEELPFDEPKFIRDNIDIKDIDGAIPKKKYPWKTRETFPLNNHDIKGSKSKKPYIRNTQYNNIDYSDLTTDIFKTKRQTNPLDPVYEIKYKNGEHYSHGMIEKSKPQTYYPYHHPDPFGLKVDDIHGSNPGSLNKISKFTGCNFNLTTRDVAGGYSGTLKRGIVTKRQTNPVDPKYKYIGDYELIGNNNNLFGKTLNQLSIKNDDPYEYYKKITPKLNKNNGNEEMRRVSTGTQRIASSEVTPLANDDNKNMNRTSSCFDIVNK